MRIASGGSGGKIAAAGTVGVAIGIAVWLMPLFSAYQVGLLSSHMVQHVVLMSVVAPTIAYGLFSLRPNTCVAAGSWLVHATAIQILLIWAWHAPSIFVHAHEDAALMVLMHVSLFASAIAFWMSVAGVARIVPWKAIFALLGTGKLFCLFGALFIFAPRVLFELSHAHEASGHVTIDDQHLAGLIMVTACPLTYVTAALVIAARWLLDVGSQDRPQAAGP